VAVLAQRGGGAVRRPWAPALLGLALLGVRDHRWRPDLPTSSCGNVGTSSDVVGLSDGLAFFALGSVTAYVCGIFSDTSSNRYLEIRRTLNVGKTWSAVHSEPYLGDFGYISLSVDPTGAVHAMHYTTDSIGAGIGYDAHYVLQ